MDIQQSGTAILPSLIFLDQQNDQSTTTKKRPNKVHVSAACANCKKAHLACDVSRPCKRCISTDKADTCHDTQHKKRGRPKMMRDSNNNKIRPLSLPVTTPTTASSSSFRMAPDDPSISINSNNAMIMIMSMDLCCARVSDHSLEYLQLYPQEFSHRSIYEFLVSGESQVLSKLHRCLLDNAVQHEKAPLPNDIIRPSNSLFYSHDLENLLSIANGSFTLKQKLKFKHNQRGEQEMQCKLYLGGGLGADLFDHKSLGQLYIVCIANPLTVVPALNNSATATATLPQPIATHPSALIQLPPLALSNMSSPASNHQNYHLYCGSIATDSSSPTTIGSEEEDERHKSNTLHRKKIGEDIAMNTATTTRNANNTIPLLDPISPSIPKHEIVAGLDKLRANKVTQQFIHPNELYYLKTKSSRLSAEAVALTNFPYLSTSTRLGSSSAGSNPLANYNLNHDRTS